MENIYTCNERIRLKLICHTSNGDPNDIRGKYFEKGMEYDAILEPRGNQGKDSKNEIFTSFWVWYTNIGYGCRFSVMGNIYGENGVPYWKNFKTVFHCPMDIERKNKINKIKSRIYE